MAWGELVEERKINCRLALREDDRTEGAKHRILRECLKKERKAGRKKKDSFFYLLVHH